MVKNGVDVLSRLYASPSSSSSPLLLFPSLGAEERKKLEEREKERETGCGLTSKDLHYFTINKPSLLNPKSKKMNRKKVTTR